MKMLVLAAASAAAVLSFAPPAKAAPEWAAAPSIALYNPAQAVRFDTVQYLWGGRSYCWYPDGWRGPGYYWCGYGARYGLGWGGPLGWHGWGRGVGFRGHGYAGGRRYYGAGFHGGGHGGGGHGGGRHH